LQSSILGKVKILIFESIKEVLGEESHGAHENLEETKLALRNRLRLGANYQTHFASRNDR
jgi:hypothetical protein